MRINNEKKYHPDLVKAAVEYCESIGADYIHDICVFNDKEWRIMYKIGEEKMDAKILPLPPNP